MSTFTLLRARQRGFTLIELLIGVGIVGLLSSITIVAINPSKQLEDAQQAARLVSAREIEKAMTQYIIDELGAGKLGEQSVVPVEGMSNAIPLCRASVDSVDCLSLASLVPTYIATVPEDAHFLHPGHSGYCVYLSSSRYRVFAVADMPDGAACDGDELLLESPEEEMPVVEVDSEPLSAPSSINELDP